MPYADKIVVLYSGGLDSTVLLHLAKHQGYQVTPLLINYGQRHQEELDTAINNCKEMNLIHRIMEVSLFNIDSGLTGNRVGGTYDGVHPMHVPGRNIIFIGLAASLAESTGATQIWYGANYEDRVNNFPDCSQEFVYHMNEVLSRSASYKITLHAPLLGMRKELVQAMANIFGIKAEDVFSGYGP